MAMFPNHADFSRFYGYMAEVAGTWVTVGSAKRRRKRLESLSGILAAADDGSVRRFLIAEEEQ
jgi:hypothetical protein